jgi:hypothetical protein
MYHQGFSPSPHVISHFCSNSINEAAQSLHAQSLLQIDSFDTHRPSFSCVKTSPVLLNRVNASSTNETAYIFGADPSTAKKLSHGNYNLTDFISEVRASSLSRKLKLYHDPLGAIFHDPLFADMVRPYCDGLWLEFGVFSGKSLSYVGHFKRRYCGSNDSLVYGFDTFKGLPKNWRPGFTAGTFNTIRMNISVPENARLVKGLFIDTLPGFLREIDAANSRHTPVSFVHIDCDLYDGARDVLFLLQSRLAPGSIIIFDELFNYVGYEDHEIKAFFEFLSGARFLLVPIGSWSDIQIPVVKEHVYQHAYGFVVESIG